GRPAPQHGRHRGTTGREDARVRRARRRAPAAAGGVLGRAPDQLRGRGAPARSRRSRSAAARARRPGGRGGDPGGLPVEPSMTRVLLWLSATAAVSLIAGAVTLALMLRAPGPTLSGPVTINVEEGARFADVAAELRRHGVLRHPLALALWARVTRQDR